MITLITEMITLFAWVAFVHQGRAHDEFPSAAEAADSGGTCMPRASYASDAWTSRLAPSRAKVW